MNFVIFFFFWIVVFVDVNLFIFFQVFEFVELVEEVSFEFMEDEIVVEVMVVLSFGVLMSGGYLKKKKKRK